MRVDCPQGAALPLEDIDGSVGRDFDGAGAVNAGGCGRTAVAAVLGLAGAGEGPYEPRGEIDDSHAVVRDIGYVQPGLCGIERQAVRLDHARAGSRSTVAAEPRRAVAGEGVDDPRIAIDPANTMVMPVGD